MCLAEGTGEKRSSELRLIGNYEIPSSFGELSNLKELSVCSNGGFKLPESLSKISGLRIAIGNNHLTLKDQDELRRRFPKATFNFVNEYDDDAANEDPRNYLPYNERRTSFCRCCR
jgi:hypothetical protein